MKKRVARSPANWSDAATYCIGEAVPDAVCQLAAIWQRADRAQWKPVYLPLMLRAGRVASR